MKTTFGFGSGLSQTGKRLLIAYTIIYVLELLFEIWMNLPVVRLFQLYPLGSGVFFPWQIITHPFIHDPRSPIGFLLNCLIFYFFSSPVERAFGPKRFLLLFYIAAFGGAVCGYLFGSIPGFNTPFMGMLPSLLAMVTIFGLLNPEATILLMFILPVKAKYLSYGTILITFLTFLAKANPHGAYHLGGIIAGLLYFKGPGTICNPKRIYIAYLEWRLKMKKSRFTVIDGKKDDDEKPTIH